MMAMLMISKLQKKLKQFCLTNTKKNQNKNAKNY